ncbi:hypothetical protein SDC9_74448 [bioreactor metagenome]|uniref:Uncharacterized protein n=1 Tax=bioreactor metagenome TaxID=1076179 RepID=A0A644YH38_9ZZZZ
MEYIAKILGEIREMFLRLGFHIEEINGEINYVYNDLYCIPHYIEHIGFFVEYADSFEQAKKNLHEDGDSYRLDIGEVVILDGLEKEIRKNIEG